MQLDLTRDAPKVIPAMKRSGRVALVAATDTPGDFGFATRDVPELRLDFEGICGDRHRGWTRPSDSRVPYLARGTEMRNMRHVSLVSADELAIVAERLRLARIDPRWVGANLAIDGIERLSFLPRGTRFLFAGGAVLVVEDQNAPCRFAGRVVQDLGGSGRTDIELGFPKHARGLRGLVASVERPGVIKSGTEIEARLPEQWLYA